MRREHMFVVGFFGYVSRHRNAFFACCFFALLVCVPFVSGTVRASSVLVFHTEPESLTVKMGDVFNVTVVVDNVPNDMGMLAAEFHLSWNSSVVKAVDVVKVLFHEASPSNVWNNTLEFSRDIDYTGGSVFYVYSVTDECLAVSGNQTLAIIMLEAVGQGSTTLNFSNVDAASSDSGPFDLSAVSCNVIVAEGAEVNPVVGSSNDTQPHYVMSIFAGSNVNTDALVLPSWTAWNDTPFSVDVQIVNVTDMAGYDFGLIWRNRVLNCTNVAIYKPDSWTDTVDLNFGINNNVSSETVHDDASLRLASNCTAFDSGFGAYHFATATNNQDGFTGTVTVATLTFLPVGQGVTPLTFFCADLSKITQIARAGVILSIPSEIGFSLTSGSVTVNESQPHTLTASPQESPVPNNSTQSPVKVSNSTELLTQPPMERTNSTAPSSRSIGQAEPLASENSDVLVANKQVAGAPSSDFVLVLMAFLALFGFCAGIVQKKWWASE